MQVWNVLHAARWKYRTQKIAKIRHLGTIAQLCWAVSLQLRHVSTMEKRVKQQYLLHIFTQYGELRPTNGWDWFGSLGHPNKFQRVSRLPFVTAAMSTKLCTMFGRLMGWYTMYELSGILLGATFTLCPSLAFSHIGSVTACTAFMVVGVSESLRRWTEGATYIRQGSHYFVYCANLTMCVMGRVLLTLLSCGCGVATAAPCGTASGVNAALKLSTPTNWLWLLKLVVKMNTVPVEDFDVDILHLYFILFCKINLMLCCARHQKVSMPKLLPWPRKNWPRPQDTVVSAL